MASPLKPAGPGSRRSLLVPLLPRGVGEGEAGANYHVSPNLFAKCKQIRIPIPRKSHHSLSKRMLPYAIDGITQDIVDEQIYYWAIR